MSLNEVNLSIPTFVLGMPINEEFEIVPLFEKIDRTTIRLNNPHFIQINCLIPQVGVPVCSGMETVDSLIKDGKCEYWSGVPSNSGGISQIAWEKSEVLVDWRVGGSFDVNLPPFGVYWMQSRGPDLTIQNFVVDTRWDATAMPTELSVIDIGSQRARISWKDNSNNEVSFHILIEQYIGDKWIKLPSYVRSNANTTSVEYQAQAGYYRFSIRSAFSNPQENWSFSRRVSADPNSPLQVVSFTTPEVITYSTVSPYVYVLVNGNFANPIAPTNFGGTSKTDKSIYFVWQDNSNNETVFHILEDKFINNSWIRQSQIRIPTNRSSYTLSPRQSGRYRYAIRSAYNFPDTNISRTSTITSWIEFTIP